MWKHYRKTLIPVQAFIFAATAFLYFAMPMEPRNLFLVFMVMQLGSLYGARVAARIKGNPDDADVLPLARRRA
jgi:uncharacterized membrane protein YfcA